MQAKVKTSSASTIGLKSSNQAFYYIISSLEMKTELLTYTEGDIYNRPFPICPFRQRRV